MADEELREEEYEETPEEEYEEEPIEEEVPEYEEDSEEVDEEDPAIPIVYEADGQTVEKNIPYSRLANIVKDYEKMNETIKKYAEYVEAVNPIIQTVQNSEILQNILYYKAQGYTEEQIKYGLAKLWGQAEEQKEYASYEDELKEKLMKEIELRLKPLEAKTQFIETEKQIEAVAQHNNQVLKETIEEMGVSELTTDQLREMGRYLAEMFPNADFRLLKLNKTIAKALVQMVVAPSKASSGGKGIGAPSGKTIKLPKVIQQKGVKTLPDKNLRGQPSKPMSLEERIKIKKELFS